MSIFEYDEEKHLKNEREFWKQEGIKEGEARLAKLLQIISEDGKNGKEKNEKVNKVLTDMDYRESLYKEYHL